MCKNLCLIELSKSPLNTLIIIFKEDKQPTKATDAKGIIPILKVKQGCTSKGCGEMGFNSQEGRQLLGLDHTSAVCSKESKVGNDSS